MEILKIHGRQGKRPGIKPPETPAQTQITCNQCGGSGDLVQQQKGG